MLGKLTVALLIAASPAWAQEAPPAEQQEGEVVTPAKPLPYKLKKVCRAHEVVGSSIPRMVCSTKRIWLEPADEAEADKKSNEALQSQL
jgi:hypothetical protein